MIRDLYINMETGKKPYLDRARTALGLTLPTLIRPDDSFTGNSNVTQQTQGLGARGVNNLANKLLTSLFPVNTPFFRLQISDYDVKELTQADDKRAEVEKALNTIERAVTMKVETNGIRVPIFYVLKLLIATGNALLYVDENGKVKVHNIENYVVSRDTFGNVKQIITKEVVNVLNLDEDIQKQVLSSLNDEDIENSEDLELYTSIVKTVDGYEIQQEIADEIVNEYTTKEEQYLALRWTTIQGEDYGRSLVDDYVADLQSLEDLNVSVLNSTKFGSIPYIYVRQGSNVRIQDIIKAQQNPGRPFYANEKDINMLTFNNTQNIVSSINQMERIEKRLGYVFLLNSSVQRQGERVTFGEISLMAEELEGTLGGVYGVLSQELQLPLVKSLMSVMTKNKEIPEIPGDTVEPTITTGLEALGRGNDLNKLNDFIAIVSQLGEEGFKRINVSDYITRVAASLGIDTQGLVISEEQIQQEQQQQVQQEQIQQQQGQI